MAASPHPTPGTLAWVGRALACRAVLAVTPLRVSSTAVHELRVELRDGAEARFALRRFVDRQRLRADPWYVPRHEATALELLATAALPAPRLVAADVEARECDVPALLTSLVPGQPAEDPAEPPSEGMLVQLAEPLVGIHAVERPAAGALPGYEPYYRLAEVPLPSWSDRPLWERVLDLVGTGPPGDGGPRFIHRDYHPGNTLWLDGQLTGVVDWTTACLGPPAVDLARMRQNLARLHGPAAAAGFLDAYVRVTGRAHDRHPWWDLRDAVDMLADTPRPRDAVQARCLSQWEAYVAQVASELG